MINNDGTKKNYIKVSFRYKNCFNKLIWDYISQLSAQLNNINLAKSLDAPEADVDNVMFIVLDSKDASVNTLVSLAHLVGEDAYEPYCDAWSTMSESTMSEALPSSAKPYVFSFDIKKYNSVMSFSAEYQSRDTISFFVDVNAGKLYYEVSVNNYVDLSPIAVSRETRDYIMESYEKYRLWRETPREIPEGSSGPLDKLVTVESVDKNSFLMPFMAYKDFMNFATYSKFNRSAIVTEEDGVTYFYNSLIKGDEVRYFSKNILRKDKFFVTRTNVGVPPALWQVLVILQHFKTWDNLHLYNNCVADLVFSREKPIASAVAHLFSHAPLHDVVKEPDLSGYAFVGHIHSNELFRLNKLYSNANRTCFFDFSTQTITGNNYVFNDEKLENKTIELSEPIDAALPLRITFTELKHYLGSDLSQKNFYAHLFTDGVHVMLERWSGDDSRMECRVIFNHDMSRSNQKLTI